MQIKFKLLIPLSLVCVACSAGISDKFAGSADAEKSATPLTSAQMSRDFLSEGSLVISRQVPRYAPLPLENGATSGSIDSPRALGFVPASLALDSTPKVVISSKEKTISLVESGKITVSREVEGISAIAPGQYKILHKQRNPLWYAPDSYFTARKLAVPAAGSKGRFLRGALGDFVLYIDKDLPLHDGPVWSNDVGGVRLDETTLSKIYYLMPVGSEVVVE